MKALIEWIKNFLGLVKIEEVKPEPVVEEQVAPPQPKAKPKPKAAPKPKAKSEPKVTKASLNKLTKAELVEEGCKVGLKLNTRARKSELVEALSKKLK